MKSLGKSKMSLRQFAINATVSQTTVYNYINKYKYELEKKGLIEVSRRGKSNLIFVLDPEGVRNFFKERNIIL